MCPNTIPIRITLAELCAVALGEVADDLETAGDAHAFIAALEANHRLWLTLDRIADSGALRINRATAGSALRLSSNVGHGIDDQHVAALATIGRIVAIDLMSYASPKATRDRIWSAYRESGARVGFVTWLLDEIVRKDIVHSRVLDHPDTLRTER